VDTGEGVGAVGSSKSGDIVLNMALHIPQVTAVVAINGCISNVATNFNLDNGKFVPGLGRNMEAVKILSDGVVDAYDSFDNPLEAPETILPVEDLKAWVLCVVGEADRNWKSGAYADMMEARVRGTPAEGLLQVVRYPGAGHLIEPPFGPFCQIAFHKVTRLHTLFGGDALAHCAAEVDSWQRMLSFFKEKLRPVSTWK